MNREGFLTRFEEDEPREFLSSIEASRFVELSYPRRFDWWNAGGSRVVADVVRLQDKEC